MSQAVILYHSLVELDRLGSCGVRDVRVLWS